MQTSLPKKFLIVGSGGRESAFALKLIEDSILYAVIGHLNPTIIRCVEKSGGNYLVGDVNNGEIISNFARENQVDYVFVNADDPLANGVIDTLLENNIKAIGGTKAANRIEWDKIYAIEMMQRVCPEFTPFFRVISTLEELEEGVEEFRKRGLSIVVKPQGLTGGKGVQVMPEHLKTYEDCKKRGADLLGNNPNEKVLLVETLEGIEFTVMGFTDGKNLVLAPASYDYPFRYEGDTGAGTGGMGCFTNSEKTLPFMTNEDLQTCQAIMQTIIDEIRHEELSFKGVLNGGFFKTKKGIRFMEFNGRFGDPEGLNILAVLEGSFSKLLESIWENTLSEEKVDFVKTASVIKYLVAKEYPVESPKKTIFYVDEKAINAMGVKIFFASCVEKNNGYETLKKSRVMALGAVSANIEDASDKVNEAIRKFVSSENELEYRRDIGSKENLEKLKRNSIILN